MKKGEDRKPTPLGQNFENLRARWGVNYSKLQLLLGLGKGVIHTYISRGSIPRMDKLQSLEAITGIPLYRLISEVIPVDEFPPAPLTIYQARESLEEPPTKYYAHPLIDATELAVRLMQLEADIRDLKRRVTELGG